jgi:hypothetical protein
MKNCIMMIVAAMGLCAMGTIAEAHYPHYYKTKWYPRYVGTTVTYYYSNYYYAPDRYHICYYYPERGRRHIYYYNWERRVYWGRFDIETGKYSLLEQKDRKENLGDIPESAFPNPVALDQVKIPGTDLNITAPPGLPE